MVVAVFLVIGGLFSGIFVFANKTGAGDTISARRNAELFIATAQGAENGTALLDTQNLSSGAVIFDGNDASDSKPTFSATLGAIKD